MRKEKKKKTKDEIKCHSKTCSGVNATLEAVPETCFLTEVAPPHVACCLCRFFFRVWDTLTWKEGIYVKKKKKSVRVAR